MVSAGPPAVAWSTSYPASRKPREIAVRSCLSSSAKRRRIGKKCWLLMLRLDGWRIPFKALADRFPAWAEEAFTFFSAIRVHGGVPLRGFGTHQVVHEEVPHLPVAVRGARAATAAAVFL